MTVASRTLADEVWALLQTVSNVNHFRGNPVIPAYDLAKPETHPFWDLDTSGRPLNVHAYTVLYPGAGRAFATRLFAVPGQTAWGFQVTCVGGDDNNCLWCADKVRGGLTGLRLTGGESSGRIRETTNPGPVRRDDDVAPPRYYLPLLFGVHVAG